MPKVLFLYPNHGSELRIPLAVSIIISSIRNAGHEVKLFDTTFIGEFKTDDEAMAKLGTHRETNLSECVGETLRADPKQELNKVVREFKPDFIFVSLVERNFSIAKGLLQGISVPVLVGGILPTIAPDFVLKEDWVSYICVGEGEEAVVDFLQHPEDSVPNIWTKTDRPYLRELISMDNVPWQDWSDFDKRHLLKPFMGKVYRGGSFEFSRGCSKSCSFCVAPKLRKAMEGCGKYHRTKHPFRAIQEIKEKIDQYDLQMISFGDTDFLSQVPKSVMHQFLKMYLVSIKLPFTIQTAAETLTDETTLGLLRDAGCCAISVGVESGSEKVRKEIIKKALPKELIKKSFDLCRKHHLRVTANYMVGLPYETEEDVRETIAFNKYLNPPSIAVTYFTPFMGTELYDVCVKEGFYQPFQENIYEYPPLKMPHLPQERIVSLVKEFSDEFKKYQQDYSVI